VTEGLRRVSLGGATFLVADDKDTFWDRFETGRWERETLEALAARIAPGTTLIDIGAWIGPITLMAAALGATVLALEPDPRAVELLGANIAANPDIGGRITVLNKAAAPSSGRIRLGSPRKPGDSMGSVLATGRGRPEWEAEAITPAEIRHLAGDARRIILKIDIEGAEYALLPALGPLLAQPAVAAFIAFHPRLLADAGRTARDIEEATAAALAALHGFSALGLDGGGGVVSTLANSTTLFERRSEVVR
jgi:FkbM family methyltransferase